MSSLDLERWRILSPYLDRALEMGRDDLAAWLEVLRREHFAVACDLERLLVHRDRIGQQRFLEDIELEILRARFRALGLDWRETR